MTRTRQILFAVISFFVALASYALTPKQMLADIDPVNLEQMIPMEFGTWKALSINENVITSPEQDEFIKNIYSQVISRVYTDTAGHQIMLSIAYTRDQSDNSGKQSHKPEICYPAQGFNVSNRSKYSLNTQFGTFNTIHLIAKLNDRVEPITYWTTIGNVNVSNQFDAKIAQINYGLNDTLGDGLIFRVSNISNDYIYSYELHKEFIDSLIGTLSEHDRKRLTGL